MRLRTFLPFLLLLAPAPARAEVCELPPDLDCHAVYILCRLELSDCLMCEHVFGECMACSKVEGCSEEETTCDLLEEGCQALLGNVKACVNIREVCTHQFVP